MDPAEAFWQRLRDALATVPPTAKTPPEGARVGAVLALFEDTPDGPRVVLTRRRRDLRSHPGQLSFPGGRVDDGESVEAAAVREAREEIGLDPGSVEVIGTGPTFYIPPSRFWVVPVVARWLRPHPLDPNPWEVDETLHVLVSTLLDRGRWRAVPLSDRGAMWAWQLDTDLLWGATAMMMATILDVVETGWHGGTKPLDLEGDLIVMPWEEFPAPHVQARLEGVPEVPFGSVPTVTAAQAREVDRLLAEDASVELSQVLEHAGRGVSHAVRLLVGGDLAGARVTVLAGPGVNGGAGLATARLVAAAGAQVTVALTFAGAPLLPQQLDALDAAEVTVAPFDDGLDAGDVVVDAMLGVGARPPIAGEAERALNWLRARDVPVVAVDLPSGLHADRGLEGPCVTADVTVALGAPKPAHDHRMARPYIGDLYLADLGIPRRVWRRAGIYPVESFGTGPLIRLLYDASPPGG